MKKKLLALLLAAVMVLSLAACGGKSNTPAADNPGASQPADGGSGDNAAEPAAGQFGYDRATGTEVYGPYWDEWSDMTDEELYELAKAENNPINVYATSSKMMKVVDSFNEKWPGLELVISDLDSDEVLSKAEIENQTNNITADVLQTKDVNGDVFFEYYSKGILEPFYPRDICSHIEEENLKFSFPLYASQAFWYYNTEAFPDGQPITSWWQIIEKNPDGSQKYRIFAKEIGQETAYLSLFASFISNAEEMEQAYKDIYGTDLEYTYDASSFPFEVPANNAGVEYLWRFTQAKMTFIGDGDELVLAVHNSTKDDPALCLASAGKIENREESGYNIAWCTNLTPYTALLNTESMFMVKNCDSPAGGRLFIRHVMGGVDGESGGFKPFTKEGNWPLRDDVEDKKNPVSLHDLGARANDLDAIYSIFPDVQDMWTYWRDQAPK